MRHVTLAVLAFACGSPPSHAPVAPATPAHQPECDRPVEADMNPEVLSWVREAPMSDTRMHASPTPFSYEAWFARGRALPRSVPTLIALLAHEDLAHPSGDGMRVAYALGWIGTRGDRDAQCGLLRTLESRDVTLRMESASALGRLGDASVLPTLAALLRDAHEDVNVRANAAVALGRLGAPSAEPILREALHDPESFVVRAAEEGLRLLHEGAAD